MDSRCNYHYCPSVQKYVSPIEFLLTFHIQVIKQSRRHAQFDKFCLSSKTPNSICVKKVNISLFNCRESLALIFLHFYLLCPLPLNLFSILTGSTKQQRGHGSRQGWKTSGDQYTLDARPSWYLDSTLKGWFNETVVSPCFPLGSPGIVQKSDSRHPYYCFFLLPTFQMLFLMTFVFTQKKKCDSWVRPCCPATAYEPAVGRAEQLPLGPVIVTQEVVSGSKGDCQEGRSGSVKGKTTVQHCPAEEWAALAVSESSVPGGIQTGIPSWDFSIFSTLACIILREQHLSA